MKYTVVYRCALCGEEIQLGAPFEMDYDALPRFLEKIVVRQQFSNNPYIESAPKQISHKCADGSLGMAYFAGFRYIE